MPSQAKIPKEMILSGALSFLIEKGYESLNIKTLAARLKCSTQPISWHFGSMEGLRKELADYALSYANVKMTPKSVNAFEAFTEVGSALIDIAFDEPELYKFLFMNGGSGYNAGGLEAISSEKDNQQLVLGLSDEFDISTSNAAGYLTNSIVYTTGLLTLIVGGLLSSEKKQVRNMVNQAGYAFLWQAGADVKKAKNLVSRLSGEEV